MCLAGAAPHMDRGYFYALLVFRQKQPMLKQVTYTDD